MTETIDSSWGDDPVQNTDKMPAFLKVLCILTYIGSGISIISGIYAIAMFEKSKAQLTTMIMHKNPLFGGGNVDPVQLSNYFHWNPIANYVVLCAGLLTLAGAFAMWKRRKTGFFVYCVGEIAPVFTGIMLIKASSGIPLLGMSSGIGGGFGIVVAVAFIIMYSLNYKHLK